VTKKRWFYALLLAVQAKVESIKTKGCFVYLRLLEIKAKNRGNALYTKRRNKWGSGLASVVDPKFSGRALPRLKLVSR